MKKNLIGIFALLGMLSAGAAYAEDAAPKVNGIAIPQARIDVRVKAIGQPDSPELRKAVREEMINLEVVGQEAVKMGLNKNPEAAQQIELAKLSVLSALFMQDYFRKNPVSDSQIKQVYEKLKPQYGGKEYSIRHILLGSEKDAKDVIALLGKAGNFEKLAAERSKDANTASRGGELGWALPGAFVPQIGKAIQSLQKGGYTREPVQSPMGWHIIKLDDTRERPAPSLEALKPQILQHLQQQAMQQAISDLRTKAKVE